jgi:hypothetical protein
MPTGNGWLVTAGALSIAAALLHLGCIFGGAPWFRALGAGEEMARAAERGAMFPTVITLFITTLLLVWAAYAFSAAGLIVRLPLARTALVAITAVLLLRAGAYFIRSQWRPDLSPEFMLWSSLIVLVLGLCFAIGTFKAWPALSMKDAL